MKGILFGVGTGPGDAEMLTLKEKSQNCGLEGEKIYQKISGFPDSAGYFSLVFAKRRK